MSPRSTGRLKSKQVAEVEYVGVSRPVALMSAGSSFQPLQDQRGAAEEARRTRRCSPPSGMPGANLRQKRRNHGPELALVCDLRRNRGDGGDRQAGELASAA